MSRCTSVIGEQALFDYWEGELAGADEDAIEEHWFVCSECALAAERARALLGALRTRIPPFVTAVALERLARRGLRMRQTEVRAGDRVVVSVGPDVDVLVHRLQVDTRGLERVDCEVESAAGEPIIRFADAVFDRERGEINVVCQRHYIGLFPPDARFVLVSVGPDGQREIGRYGVLHALT
ncbi:MAG: zf-HC2 domain-containing protein [Labilithrix sp.]|nr:zf-HC2 domain-containing protein [Labilithrix sp.]